jgi:hypothetical protein
MPLQCPPRPLSVLASALAAASLVLAVGGCSSIAPLGQDPPPVNLPSARDLGSPISMQIMRSQPPSPTGKCPAGSIALFGSEPNVPRSVSIGHAVHFRITKRTTASLTPVPAARPAAPPARTAGLACYRPVGKPVSITSAAVSAVTTERNQPGAPWYVFVVAFPTADEAALTELVRQAYSSGDALGLSVAGKLWQAPQPRHKFNALRAEQIDLLSRNQAAQLYRLLVRSG